MTPRFYFQIKIFSLFIGVFLLCVFPDASFGAVLRPERVRDVISNSSPSAGADHEIEFRVTQAIPPSGKIIITPEAGEFLIPIAFNLLDVDLAVAAVLGGVYAERDLTDTASVANIGVSIQTGFSGSVIFTLNSAAGLSSGNMVRIKLGTIASHGGNGTNYLVNADTARSYKISVETRDAADLVIDSGGTMVVMIEPISVGPVDTTDRTPAVISGGMPAGLLPGGTRAVELSLYTNETASCRYAASSGVPFSSMTGVFSSTEKLGEESFFHYGAIASGLLDVTPYIFYVKCSDWRTNVNSEDYLISFSIGVVPSGENAGPGSGSGAGSGSTGSGEGGGTGNYQGTGSSGSGSGGVGDVGGGNYLKTSDVSVEGTAYPSSKVAILLDGKQKAAITTAATGKFSVKILALERGTYTFGMYAVDAKGLRSSMISSTVSLRANTVNTVAGLLFPPTITTEHASVKPAEDIVVSGSAIPKSAIEVFFGEPSSRFETKLPTATTTADASGQWSAIIKTKGLATANYIAQARSVLSASETSGMSAKLQIGLGKEAAADFSLRSDLNNDGKVNLADFSIFLFSWGTNDKTADINMNGKVDISDFSILIYYWTG
ncbi:MAG: dockerin type I domain-containing protein [Candidatus Paceibacterota bacterium]|jgi:hypothetical protein|nr:hypothetical protein [Candidatus Paceibacterota bacterium]